MMKTTPLQFQGYPTDEMVERSRTFCEELSRRRTVREFESTPIPAEVLDQILRTAVTAPSGANRQPWRFVVVTDLETKQKIREGAEREEREFYTHRATQEWLDALAPLGTDEHKPFLTEAPVLIAIFLERYGMTEDGRKIKNYYMPESVGIASGFLIAAFHHAGLATLTHTPSPMRFLNEILDRPSREKPFLLLVAGYPKPQTQVPDIQRFPINQSVIYWDN